MAHVTARGCTRNNRNRDPRNVGMATLHVMGRYFWHPIWGNGNTMERPGRVRET
jgi:hypothetical protein